jgi:hypothetical protein
MSRARSGKITSTQFFLIDKGILQWCTKNAVNKRIIERPIFFPRLRGGKIYAKNLKFCIAAVFVVCQRGNNTQPNWDIYFCTESRTTVS